MLQDHLILAAEHVARSEKTVRDQRRLVDRLERDGHDCRMALELLEEFEKTLQLYRDDLARIRQEVQRYRRGRE